MIKHNTDAVPPIWRRIQACSVDLGFDMPSDMHTGALLRVLAASKPAGRMLELGTGTGLATACILAGMNESAQLVSVDTDEAAQAVARGFLADDPRVNFILADGLDYIIQSPPQCFDLIFADAWPGKYERVDAALRLLRPGGLYVGDDMSPQANWPENHQQLVDALVAFLASAPGMTTATLDWGSGFIISART